MPCSFGLSRGLHPDLANISAARPRKTQAEPRAGARSQRRQRQRLQYSNACLFEGKMEDHVRPNYPTRAKGVSGGTGSSYRIGRDVLKRRCTRTTGFGNIEEDLSFLSLRHVFGCWQRRMPWPGQEPCLDEIDLNPNPELVDELPCAGDSGPRVMLKHLEEQVGSIPDLWHRKWSWPSPESLTPGTTSCVPATEDDA